MNTFINNPFTFIMTIFNALVSLGDVLYTGMTYSITIPEFVTDIIGVAPFNLSLMGLLGGVGLIAVIIWRIVKWLMKLNY